MPIPPGLIAVKDLLDRFPREREALLSYEIQKRVREHLLYVSTKQLMRLQIWSTLKSLLIWMVTVFSIVFTVGTLSSFGRWLQNAGRFSINLPPPLPSHYQIDVSSLVPTSTVLATFARFPSWDWRNALTFTLLIVGIVLIEKIIVGYFTVSKARELRQAGTELEEEIRVLKEWRGSVDGRGKTA